MKRWENSYKPSVFWSWNGRITEKGVREQVRGFARAGLGGFFVHARGGLKCEYFSEEWFRLFGAAAEEAARCGLDVWIYDENGWPSGFGGGRVNGKSGRFRMKRLRAGAVPGSAETILSGGHVLSVTEEKGYVDLLDAAVTETFLNEIHEEYARRFKNLFGGTIKGVFTDEPQLDNGGGPYSAVLPQEFERRRGYPLQPELYKLFFGAPEAERFRRDYFETVQELFTENYTARVARWCEKNGLLFTGHFPCEDGLCFQPSVTGGVMRHYREMQMPGIDHLGRRYNSPVLLKQLSSVCSIYGKPIALSETFGGAGYGVSFAELSHMWAYQAALGVNFCCLHLAAYTVAGAAKRDYPPVFSFQQPWYEAAPALYGEIEAINRFASRGKSAADILLVSALGSARICRLESAKQRFVSSEFRSAVENLLSAQAPFDIADESFLAGAALQNGRIVCGEKSYSLLLLPYMLTVEEATLCLASDFAKSGGKVLFIGAPPKLLDGRESDVPEKAYARFTPMANRCGYFRKAFEYIGYSPAARLAEEVEGKTAEKIVSSVRGKGGEIFLFAVNADLSADRFLVAEFMGAGQIYLYSLRSGEENPLASRVRGEKTYAAVHIPAYGYLALVFRKKETARGSAESFAVSGGRHSSLLLEPVRAVREGDNALVIDRAACDIDGFSRERNVEKLRKIVFGAGGAHTIRYRFFADSIPCRLRICAETAGEALLNGKKLFRRGGAAADGEISCFDASGAVRKGENVVELYVNAAGPEDCESESFETLKNIFSYSAALENLILLGDFGLKGYTESGKGCGRWFSADGEFRLASPSVPDPRDFTSGAPFYAGNVRVFYEFGLQKRPRKAVLRLTGACAVAARAAVNGEDAGVFVSPPFETEISRFLRRGKNIVEILYYGHLRNLFGPFHHYKGDPQIASPESFAGERGFADSYTNPGENENTSVREYNFLRFGGGRALLLTEEER